MKTKLTFIFKILKFYKKKIFKILIYEIYFSIKYFKTGNYIKLQKSSKKTDTIPCPYYFLHKISQFINKKKITNVIDLGSGFGRAVNYLDDTTKAFVVGYEDDKNVCDISVKNKNSNVTIKNEDILNIDYNNIEIECFIINNPFQNKIDFETLIKKIEFNIVNLKKKIYFISINVDEDKMDIFNNYKLIKSTSAGQSKHIKFFSN